MFMNPSGHCHGHSRGPQPFQGDHDLQPIQGGLPSTFTERLLHVIIIAKLIFYGPDLN